MSVYHCGAESRTIESNQVYVVIDRYNTSDRVHMEAIQFVGIDLNDGIFACGDCFQLKFLIIGTNYTLLNAKLLYWVSSNR